MDFTIDFLLELAHLLLLGWPLLVALLATISILAVWIGRQEGWPLSDSLYYGFITATTVGYGDFHPLQGRCKYLAIVIALLGIILTGIVVAVSVEAVSAVVDNRNAIPGTG